MPPTPPFSARAQPSKPQLSSRRWNKPPRPRKRNSSGTSVSESLLRRKYVIPFVLACVILACNQATGVNSIIGYNTNILLQSGLSDLQAHWGYVLFTVVNFLMTIGGILLVDRKGRKFLLSLGSAGIIVSLICTGLLFHRTESLRIDSRDAVQSMVEPGQKITLHYDEKTANALLAISHAAKPIANRPTSLVVIYSYGDFRAATKVARSDDTAAAPIEITRESCVPANKVVAFFTNPFSDLDAARNAPLRVDNALITPGSHFTKRLAGRHHSFRIHGVLRHRPRSLRLAGAL